MHNGRYLLLEIRRTKSEGAVKRLELEFVYNYEAVVSGGATPLQEYKEQEKSKSGDGWSHPMGRTQYFPSGDQGSSPTCDQMLN